MVSYLQGGVTYTTLYNLLNYPSGCVPVTRVTAIDENNMRDYPETNLTLKMVKKVHLWSLGMYTVYVLRLQTFVLRVTKI